MEIRRREIVRLYRSAVALLGMTALDPAICQPELSGNSDVVILALRDMQDIVACIALLLDEGEDLFKEGRVRLFRTGRRSAHCNRC